MKISWNINKKQGNFRPHLHYTICLEGYERELAVHTINLTSTIPKIPCAHEAFCLPNIHERKVGWQPNSFHQISTPYFRDGTVNDYIRLPFRKNNDYPEIEESFAKLRYQFEVIVRDAYGAVGFTQEKELDTSSATKEIIAAHLAARKMLAFCTQ